jgi:hypothetical protein
MIGRPAFALVVVLALWTAPSCRSSAQAPSSSQGQLVVIVVVDQLRFEYLDRFKGFWKEGFARLMDDGAVFEHAYYPYMNTVTCVGHATISTGTLPATHGIVLNEWWQRSAGRRLSCTDDAEVKSVPYDGGAAEGIGHSAHRLRVPTLGDRLRAASPQSRVVTLSMKPRSTVMLAGHGATVATWFSTANVWSTSTAFTMKPLAEVQAWVGANPVDSHRNEIWNRRYDPGRYSGVDNGVGEQPPRGWTPLFPHPLAGTPGTEPAQFYELWERSPYSDAALGNMAASLVRSLSLGQRGVIDYLGVSFSTLDYVGHAFGPESHEVQDTLFRLDRTLGQFLDALDKTVGRDRYVLALSADHGVSVIPEAWSAQGHDAGRVLNPAVRKVAEAAMAAAHGPGPHVAHVEYTDLYLTEVTRKRAAAKPDLLRPLITAVSKMPGVLRVFPSAGLENKRASRDPLERAAALGYVPGESGDVFVVLKPNWINSDSAAATHGSFHPYDQHVPVIFFGKSIKDGRFKDPATPADIAPTLASIVRLAMPGVDGKVLQGALK